MKRFKVLPLSIFVFIILSSSVISGISQSINSSPYSGSYKVHVGDKTRYDYTTVLVDHEKYFGSFGQLFNGTTIPINITKGNFFTIEVARIDYSSIVTTKVYINSVLYMSHYEPFRTKNALDYIFINPGFNDYFKAFTFYNRNNGNLNFNISRDGDVIKLLSYSHNPNNLTTTYLTEYNWKSGWLEAEAQKISYANGTIVTNLVYQRHIDDLISSIANVTTNALEIGSILIIIAIPVIIGLSYRSYSQKVKNSGKSQSFLQYLQLKARYTKKNAKKRSRKEAHSTDKALQTIESILEETSNSK